MANVIRTARTYSTPANAERHLRRVAGEENMERIRWMVAVAPDGRFAPVVLNPAPTELLHFASNGVTVLS
jgi:hypothetical protein